MLEFALSPNGKELAELKGGHGRNCVPKEIVIDSIAGVQVIDRRILVGPNAARLEWIGRHAVAFLQGRNLNNVSVVDTDGGSVKRVFSAPGPVLNYAFDFHKAELAYAYQIARRSTDYVSARVMAQTSMLGLALPGWATAKLFGGETRFGVRTFGAKGASLSAETNLHISQLAWLANPVRPVMLRQAGIYTPWNSTLVDMNTGATVVSADQLADIYAVAASSSGLFAVAATGVPDGRFEEFEPMHIYVVDTHERVHQVSGLSVHRVLRLWWGRSRYIWADAQYAEPNGGPIDERLMEVDWRQGRVVRTFAWPGGSLKDCKLDLEATVAVCVAETLTKTGQLVKLDLVSGKVVTLDGLGNPIDRVNVSFREVRVVNGKGRSSTGFLAVPKVSRVDPASGPPLVPLAIMMYGFEREYAAGGQWIGAYPVTRLVHAGIAVLMLNFATPVAWRMGDFSAARAELLVQPLATVESAPDAVRQAGVRVGKVMVMGWSWGGFIAAHAIEDSCEFVAAEVGDPAAWNVASYGLWGPVWRSLEDGIFGGPPYDKYVYNYAAFDPMHSGAMPNGPIMLEFVSRNVNAGQYLEEWRARHAYVEAFVYHHSVHSLDVLNEREQAKERNLAWAKLNLLGPQSVESDRRLNLGLSAPPPGAYRCTRRASPTTE